MVAVVVVHGEYAWLVYAIPVAVMIGLVLWALPGTIRANWYRCPYSGCTYRGRKDQSVHVRNAHELIACPECAQQVAGAYYVAEHLKTEHGVVVHHDPLAGWLIPARERPNSP